MWYDNYSKYFSIILTWIFIIFIMIFFLREKEYDEEYILHNTHDIKISELTNFKWDYAKVFVENLDFQKIAFFHKNKLIFEQLLNVDSEGDILSQAFFINKESGQNSNSIVYYRCPYLYGELKFIKKTVVPFSDGEKRVFVFYEPIHCKEVTYDEYLEEQNQ